MSSLSTTWFLFILLPISSSLANEKATIYDAMKSARHGVPSPLQTQFSLRDDNLRCSNRARATWRGSRRYRHRSLCSWFSVTSFPVGVGEHRQCFQRDRHVSRLQNDHVSCRARLRERSLSMKVKARIRKKSTSALRSSTTRQRKEALYIRIEDLASDSWR